MKTFTAKPESVQRDWFVVDAAGKTLAPHVDTGDYIIVVNADKVTVTGNKAKNKMYYSHSGFPGGIKEINFEKLLAKKPEMVLESAIKGMLPKGPLGRAMFRKLKVYAGAEHQHAAQQPQVLDI